MLIVPTGAATQNRDCTLVELCSQASCEQSDLDVQIEGTLGSDTITLLKDGNVLTFSRPNVPNADDAVPEGAVLYDTTEDGYRLTAIAFPTQDDLDVFVFAMSPKITPERGTVECLSLN
ncbi:MAG: hypothetical protein AAGL89_01845 [Pseudomonadota bacterium]